MEKQIFVLMLLLGLINALNFNKTSCPEVKTVDHFSFNSFSQGIWYTYGRYSNDIENNENSVAYKGRHARLKLYKFKMLDIAESSPEYIEVDFSLAEDINMKFIYGKPKKNKTFNVKFPLFDSKKYVVIYSCKYDETENVTDEYAWIGVRSINPDKEIKAAIEDFIKTSNILDYNQFKWLNLVEDSGRNKARRGY